jgi:hypothetical protein
MGCQWQGRCVVDMSKKGKAVPPTPYYLGVRAELFLHDAEQALREGKKERHAQLMLRATEYQRMAGQLPMEGNNE